MGDPGRLRLTAESAAGRSPMKEIVGVYRPFAARGTDTTRNVLTSALHYMARTRPRRHARRDPGLIERAAREFCACSRRCQTIGPDRVRDTSIGGRARFRG